MLIEEKYNRDYVRMLAAHEFNKSLRKVNVGESEREVFCDRITDLAFVFLPERKMNLIGLGCFFDYIRSRKWRGSENEFFRHIVNKVQTEEGYRDICTELEEDFVFHEMLSKGLKKNFGAGVIDELGVYDELKTLISRKNREGADTELLENLVCSIKEAIAYMDIEANTPKEVASIIRRLRLSPERIVSLFSTPEGVDDFVRIYTEEKAHLTHTKGIQARINRKEREQCRFMQPLQAEVQWDTVKTQLIRGIIPRPNVFIKIAYATNTTLEYLLLGRNEMPYRKVPIEKVLDETGQYRKEVFIARLQEFAEHNRKTLWAISRETEIALPVLYAWTKGESAPTIPMLLKLCGKYGINIDYLLGLKAQEDDLAFVEAVKKEQEG